MKFAVVLVLGWWFGCPDVLAQVATTHSPPASQPVVRVIARLKRCCGGLVAWSSDGSKLITLNGGSVGNDGSMRQAQIWDTATFKPIGKPLDHDAPIRRIEWDARSARVLTIGSDRERLKNNSRGGYARLWDANTGALLRTITHDKLPLIDASLSPDGKLIATAAGTDPTVRLLDADTGELKNTLVHDGNLDKVRFDRAGTTLVTVASGKARLWDIKTKKARAVLKLGDFAEYYDPIITADGKCLVLLDCTEATMVNVATGQITARVGYRRHLDDSLEGWSVNADGSRLAVTTILEPFTVWEVATGKRIFELEKVYEQAALSPNGRLLLIAPGLRPRLCNIETGQSIELDSDDLYVPDAEFSPDGKKIAVPDYGRIDSVSVFSVERE